MMIEVGKEYIVFNTADGYVAVGRATKIYENVGVVEIEINKIIHDCNANFSLVDLDKTIIGKTLQWSIDYKVYPNTSDGILKAMTEIDVDRDYNIARLEKELEETKQRFQTEIRIIQNRRNDVVEALRNIL